MFKLCPQLSVQKGKFLPENMARKNPLHRFLKNKIVWSMGVSLTKKIHILCLVSYTLGLWENTFKIIETRVGYKWMSWGFGDCPREFFLQVMLNLIERCEDHNSGVVSFYDRRWSNSKVKPARSTITLVSGYHPLG